MFILLFCVTLAELILRDFDYLNAIDLTSVHLYQISDYSFHVQTTVNLKINDEIYIQFPAEYESLTMTSCSMVILPNDDPKSYSPTCAILSKSIKLVLPVSLVPSKLTIKILGIQNPLNYRTTGLFSLYSKTPGNMDYSSQNTAFASLAFAGRLVSTVTEQAYIASTYGDYSSVCGETTNYVIQFLIKINLDSGTWFRFKLPTL